MEVVFTSPAGKAVRVGGFYYGFDERPDIRVRQVAGKQQVDYLFDKHNLWKARFAPAEAGKWTYAYSFTDAAGAAATGAGGFECVRGATPAHGFVRPHASYPFRWVFDDGTAYFPIGLQDGYFDGNANGSALDEWSLEGPFRQDRAGRPALPPGPLFKAGPSNNPVNADMYFRTYSRCGFNLYRFSQRNFSMDLYTDLDHYLIQQAVMVDELLQCCRRYDMRVMYGLFGYMPVFAEEPSNAEGMAKVKRFIQYSVNRWGAYVDFWELLNEQKADAAWYGITVPFLKGIDPYHHPVATSWERPELDGIDINAPHWYQDENELASASETARHAAEWKKFNKPVIVGEQGNFIDPKADNPPGVAGAWDPRSALRMRIRIWTALMSDISFVFWNTSYAKDGHNMNIWLGPLERQYVAAMQGLAECLDADVKPTDVATSDQSAVRGYGLASAKHAGVYLHHFRDHQTPVQGLKVSVKLLGAGTAYWYSPETAELLGKAEAKAGTNTFEAPPFTVDLALLVTADGPPDIDHDGKPNDVDDDNDNDGVPNAQDAFPLDPWSGRTPTATSSATTWTPTTTATACPTTTTTTASRITKRWTSTATATPKPAVPWDAWPDDPKRH